MATKQSHHRAFECAALLALIGSTAMCNTNVFFDNFNDGNTAGWTIAEGAWGVANSNLVGVGGGTGYRDGWIYSGNTNWSDYAIDADIHFQTGNAGLAFRSTGHEQNEYRIDLWSDTAGSASNRFCVAKYDEGVVSYFTEFDPYYLSNELSPVPITSDIHVRIEAVGSLLSLYIDGTKIFEANDPNPLTNGRMGLGVIWEWTAGFDNISVELIPEVGGSFYGVAALGLVALIRRMIKKRSRRATDVIL